ncbi:MAG TPA: TraB/GumN family protein [Candidatus Poseidoniales archaeon]|jgi:pheromone shutdown-related protein TraB|nr:MAG: TraB family protein [Euryarchaeota archaeon]HIE81947.1 TraB/GumN family protein [Candidatus Poseidoniales archaeon]HIL50059.1 TraB/GumN family protein [Candidatus Poseidoniales archaeon]
MGQTIIDVDDNLRLVGTAHVSSASVTLVREQIDEYGPDLVAVELCESRLKSLKRPDDLANSDLLNIINEGRSSMILLQSALAAQQRRMGIETGEKPGAELLAAIEAADAAEIPYELIDRDVVITLRRAWRKMGLREKWRVLNALLWDEDDDEVVDFDEMLEDTDLLSAMMEEAKAVAPRAGEVLIDERDAYLAGRIQQIRGKGRILAVVGAGHLSGIVDNLQKPPQETTSNLANLREEPSKPRWPKVIMWAIPLFLASVVGWLVYNGETDALKETLWYWLAANAALAGIGVALARGHPLSILVGAAASPITSLNPTLAAGWFAGYTQLKVAAPTGKDAAEFLALQDFDVFWNNRVGRVLLVTAFGNIGSALGAWLAGGAIIGILL